MYDEKQNLECKNQYTESIFYESFGNDDTELKKCESCPYLTYEDGMIRCEKFN